MASEHGDRYTQPPLQLSRRSTLSSIQELDADRVPQGTVASRILRLQQKVNQSSNSSPPPFPERDRDGESSGWGRRVEGEVRLIQPASHANSIEVNHGTPRRVVSSYLRRPSTLWAIPETDTASSVRHRPPISVVPRSSNMASSSSADSPPSAASSRFDDGRQILQEHRISLPRG
jgi:hypothetical protein